VLIIHVEATLGVPKKEDERYAVVQKTIVEILTETVSSTPAKIQTPVAKMQNVKQMATEQFAVVQEDGLVSHMLEEDALIILATKILVVQTQTVKTRMETLFVHAGQIMKEMLTLAVN